MRDLLSELDSVLDALATVDVHAMPEPAALIHTEALLTAQVRFAGLSARALQACDARDVTVNECGRTTKSWLVEEQHLSPGDAGRRIWVARRLPLYPAVADALNGGEISHDHAHCIVACLLKLDPPWREAAEGELLDFARDHDPAMLGQLCQQLRIRSGADESTEAAALRKYDDRWVSVSPSFDGMVGITGMLDPFSGATLAAALAPLLLGTDQDDDRTGGQRCADALTELAQMALNRGDLPDHGGERPQVMVSIPWPELRDGIAAGELGHATINGRPITANTARMIACDANIIPAVLGGVSEVLDLGRSTPTWSRAQRRARRLADQGCTWPGCQAGLERCQIHHINEWQAQQGPTDVKNGTHICRFHHWLVHHTDWTIKRNTEGRIEVRRT